MVVSDESSARSAVSHAYEARARDGRRTLLVVLQSLLEVCEIALLVCARDGAHTLHVPELRVLRCELDREKGRDVFWLQTMKQKKISSLSDTSHVLSSERTRFSMTLHRSMYLSAPSALGSSCVLRFSNVS